MGSVWSDAIGDITQSKQKLYDMVKWQNQMMEVEQAKLRDQFSTDSARIKYIGQDIMGWNQLNFILWLIYYVIVLGIFYLFYSNENIELTKNQKIKIGVFFVLYPFLITSAELLVYNIIIFIKSLIQGTPYPKQSHAQPTFSFLNGLPSVYF